MCAIGDVFAELSCVLTGSGHHTPLLLRFHDIERRRRWEPFGESFIRRCAVAVRVLSRQPADNGDGALTTDEAAPAGQTRTAVCRPCRRESVGLALGRSTWTSPFGIVGRVRHRDRASSPSPRKWGVSRRDDHHSMPRALAAAVEQHGEGCEIGETVRSPTVHPPVAHCRR